MNIISKEETFSGEAIVVDSKQIQINYPFGYFSKIKMSNVVVRVGIGYGKGDFSWQNVTFYDSLCRTCQNGFVDTNQVWILN